MKIGEGQLSHFASQVGAFHAALESWRGGPTKAGNEWRSTGLPLPNDSELGPKPVPLLSLEPAVQ